MSKTSTAVKQRWLDKTYTPITVRLPNDLVDAFKQKCIDTDTPQRAVIQEALENFIYKK